MGYRLCLLRRRGLEAGLRADGISSWVLIIISSTFGFGIGFFIKELYFLALDYVGLFQVQS